jgi:hypothetical protein
VATNFLWGGVGAVIHLLTTELNSRIDGEGTPYGPEVGGVNNYQLGQLSLHIASNSLAFTLTSRVDVFFVPSITTASGAAYPTYTSGSSYKLAESNYFVGSIAVNPATQSANVVDEALVEVRIPLGFFKAILVNHTGVTLPSSGNTLDLYPTPTQTG